MSKPSVLFSELLVNNTSYRYADVAKMLSMLGLDISELPFSLRIMAENLIRQLGSEAEVALRSLVARNRDFDYSFKPARVVLQDLLGTPALVDLAGLRDAVAEQGGDPLRVNPKIPTHFIVDHSVNVNSWGDEDAYQKNMLIEAEINKERFSFLDWADGAFSNLTIIKSGNGILHQVNLERLTSVVATLEQEEGIVVFPDTLVGTDSHTTMINAIGVLGWGVGGIEAESAMLGRSLVFALPEIIGVYLDGMLPPGYIATDIALLLAQRLRKEGVVGSIVEFYGPGVENLSLADRATISNMAPEFGATAAMFPIDQNTIRYLEISGRGEHAILAEAYAKAQGLWATDLNGAVYDRSITINLSDAKRAISGPIQPHQRLLVEEIAISKNDQYLNVEREQLDIVEGDVVIAAITSCTNTSNPRGVITAALIAKKALEAGLVRKPWVKTSFAPGSRVVTDYLASLGLDKPLYELGFNIVGYGCMTCNGMSGPLASPELEQVIRDKKLNVTAVTSGNRNFAGRVHPLAREVFIMSPPMIVAHALAGTTLLNFDHDPIGIDSHGLPIYLSDLWPSDDEVQKAESNCLTASLFEKVYQDIGVAKQARIQAFQLSSKSQYEWNASSTYIQKPPYWLPAMRSQPSLKGMRVLAQLGDHITTDHISPSGAILPESDAGRFLLEHGIGVEDFNSYGTRRGNHIAAQRATFANPRLLNEVCADGREGPFTRLLPDNTYTTIFTAAMAYKARNVPLVVVAGQNYGSGSSRDWAAKGPKLLGVSTVLAESFERIHRSNLAGMGILPLAFVEGVNRQSLNLTGEETFTVLTPTAEIQARTLLSLEITFADGQVKVIQVRCRLDTDEEVKYFQHGGLLPALLPEYL